MNTRRSFIKKAAGTTLMFGMGISSSLAAATCSHGCGPAGQDDVQSGWYHTGSGNPPAQSGQEPSRGSDVYNGSYTECKWYCMKRPESGASLVFKTCTNSCE